MYCVIVGDIIRSKSLETTKRNESTDAISKILDYINSKYENDILANFGIVRGDAFEGVLFSQQMAPKIIQDIIMGLYDQDIRVRISAAMGELSVISSERNKADGPAFYTALSLIESLRRDDSSHWFQVSMLTNSIGQPLVDGLLHMITALTKGWTPKQTNIVWTMIKCDNKQIQVSEKLDIKPSVVSKQLKSAQYDAYQLAWLGLEEYLTELEEKTILPAQANPAYTTYYSLANRKTEQEEFSAAVSLYEKALALALDDFGEDNPNLVRIYNGLINAYLELVQKGSFSLEEKEKYLDLIKDYINTALNCQKNLPKTRIEHARTIALNGDYLGLLKKYDEALLQHMQAIQIMEYCDHAELGWVAECYNNMGMIYNRKNMKKEALNAYQTALSYAERIRASDPIRYAAAHYNLGLFYVMQKQNEDAIPLLSKALTLFTNLLPSQDSRIDAIKIVLEKLQAK